MSDPYLGQVEIFSFPFAPKGWAQCNGQMMLKSQNAALYQLLGDRYGSNATQFALPDLRGRVAVGWGHGNGLSNYDLGQTGGEENHTLASGELGPHSHSLMVDTSQPATNNTNVPSTSVVLGNTVGTESGVANLFNLYLYHYASNPPSGTLDPHAIGPTGGGGKHTNIMPYLTLNFCICIVATPPQL